MIPNPSQHTLSIYISISIYIYSYIYIYIYIYIETNLLPTSLAYFKRKTAFLPFWVK